MIYEGETKATCKVETTSHFNGKTNETGEGVTTWYLEGGNLFWEVASPSVRRCYAFDYDDFANFQRQSIGDLKQWNKVANRRWNKGALWSQNEVANWWRNKGDLWSQNNITFRRKTKAKNDSCKKSYCLSFDVVWPLINMFLQNFDVRTKVTWDGVTKSQINGETRVTY